MYIYTDREKYERICAKMLIESFLGGLIMDDLNSFIILSFAFSKSLHVSLYYL